MRSRVALIFLLLLSSPVSEADEEGCKHPRGTPTSTQKVPCCKDKACASYGSTTRTNKTCSTCGASYYEDGTCS